MSDIQGRTDPRFSRVADAFRENLASRGEVGAAVCVTVEGKTVVDLWGGTGDRRKNEPWRETTAVMVFSSHPPTGERIENVRKNVEGRSLPATLERDSPRFQEIKKRVLRG